MAKEAKTTKLARLLLARPDLPVRVMVSRDLYNSENENYNIGEIAWGIIGDEYKGEDYVHLKDWTYANCEEVLADACRKGDIHYLPVSFDVEDFTDEEIENMYNGLPWKECIVVYVE